MNANRRTGLEDMRARVGVPVELVTEERLGDWVVPRHPLPAAYRHLSPVHRSDYLRAYLMHHHGGGYADVKPAGGSWIASFEALDADPHLLGAGYRERSPSGVAVLGLDLRRRWDIQPFLADWWRYRWLQFNHRKLIALCAFVFRPRTALTATWLSEVERRLARLAPALERAPARFPKERPGHLYDGVRSEYPVPWSHLLGDIFHPLVWRHRHRILQTVPAPTRISYQ